MRAQSLLNAASAPANMEIHEKAMENNKKRTQMEHKAEEMSKASFQPTITQGIPDFEREQLLFAQKLERAKKNSRPATQTAEFRLTLGGSHGAADRQKTRIAKKGTTGEIVTLV
jgi:hypothetical protein